MRYSLEDAERGGAYDGQWLAGQRSGVGTMTQTDGSVYTGAWVSDVRCGSGAFFSIDGLFCCELIIYTLTYFVLQVINSRDCGLRTKSADQVSLHTQMAIS